MNKYRQFTDACKILMGNSGREDIPNSYLKAHLSWPNSELIAVREFLIEEGFVKRGKGQSTRLIKEYLKIAPVKLSLNFEQIIEKIIQEKQISFELISSDVKEIKQFKKILNDKYGVIVKIDFENELISYLESKKEDNFFAGFESSFKWFDPDDELSVRRLVEILDWQELFDVSGDVGKLIRKIVKIESGQDKKGTKFEIASTMVMKHGKDLFREVSGLSELIDLKNGQSPKRWRAGSSSSIAFVTKYGFPRSYAGEPNIKSLPSRYYAPIHQLPELRNFQIKAKNEVASHLKNEGSRLILRMPTGTGKTRTGIECINDWFVQSGQKNKKNVVFWIAHTEELCEQAMSQFGLNYLSNKIRKFPVETFRLWGEFVNENKQLDQDDEQIDRVLGATNGNFILVSNNILLNRIVEDEERIPWVKKLCNEANILMVIDEAHRSGAETYKDAIAAISRFNRSLQVFGLTATPKRATGQKNEGSATEDLLNMFNGSVVDPFSDKSNPKKFLVESKILAKPNFKEIQSKFEVNLEDIDEVFSPNADGIEFERMAKIESEIAARVESWQRRKPVIEYISELCKNPSNKIIYFGSSNADSEMVAWGLRKYGVSSEYITANTSMTRRRKIIRTYKNGTTQVLCNCMILTTGFDNPKITHVVIGRPTISTVLFEQMIGRGLRGPEFSGTENCEIIYVRDFITPNPIIKFAFDKIKSEWEDDLNGNTPLIQYKEARVFERINHHVSRVKKEEFIRETKVEDSSPALDVYNWLWSQMVNGEMVKSMDLYQQFKTTSASSVNSFLLNLSHLLNRSTKSIGTGIALPSDTALASVLSSKKNEAIGLIERDLHLSNSKKAA